MVGCPICGTANRAGHRFCVSCGKPLPEGAPPIERCHQEGPVAELAEWSVITVIEPSPSCLACGAAARAETSFCESCGHSLAGDQVARTADPTPLGPRIPVPRQVAGVLMYRGPSEPATLALAAFRRQMRLAGAVAVGLVLIAWLFLPTAFFVAWLISGVFVAWRCFVRIPYEIRNIRYHQARRMALTTALINLILAGGFASVLLLIAYFRSGAIEDAPPLYLQRVQS